VALPHDGGAEWAWFARVPVREPFADVHLFLSAEDLRPLLMYPTSVSALVGEARLFPVSPARDPQPVGVCLRDLGDDPPGGLCGARVRVTTALGDAVLRADRYFDLTEADPEFDEASAYHHAGRALRFFGEVFRPELFDAPLFQPLRLVVHDPRSRSNAFFHPDRGEITLGDWPAGPTAARAADIVMHEIGHAVTHAVARLAAAPKEEAKGVGEGFSDYFACSALDDPRFGDYVTGRPDGARNCAKVGLAPVDRPGQVGRYVVGEAWANVLWEVREQVGPSVADAVAAESLYFAQTLVTVQEALAALHAADAALFPSAAPGRGRHADVIPTASAARFS
jgi:hypothetical protein